MPGLTVRQPWATALVHPDLPKTIETRGRRMPAKYLGVDVAIIAGLNTDANGYQVGDWEWAEHWGRREINLSHYASGTPGAPDDIPTPLGAIIGTVRFDRCVPIVGLADAACSDTPVIYQDRGLWEWSGDIDEAEAEIYGDLEWGDYTPGRWAWVTDPAFTRMFACPVPHRGALHWQTVEVPS